VDAIRKLSHRGAPKQACGTAAGGRLEEFGRPCGACRAATNSWHAGSTPRRGRTRCSDGAYRALVDDRRSGTLWG